MPDQDSEAQTPAADRPVNPYQVRATHLLRRRGIWQIPVVVGSVVLILMTTFYIGSVVDPLGHLRGLPVSIVNEDSGATVGGTHLNLGTEVEAGLTGSHVVSRFLAMTPEGLAAAERRMGRADSYAALVIPPDFSKSLLSLAGAPLPSGSRVGAPTITLLTNPRAGTIGVSLASGVLTPAVGTASHKIGRQLLASARPSPTAGTAMAAVLANPVALTTRELRPPSSHSALGLSAFYVSLLALMCGFLAATIINVSVDVATGYATTDIGPRWRQRMPLPINRWQTLLTKWLMAVPVTCLLAGLVLLVAVEILGMTAPDVGLLWLFMWLAAVSVAAGTLMLFAAFGSQGQLLAMLLFVYLGLASAGGTIPIQALPEPLRLISEIEPLRQILAGVRSILYFNAAGDAGLTRGLIAASAGLVFWLVIGTAVVRWYDSKGLHRLPPEVLAHIQRSVGEYQAAQAPQAADGPADSPQGSPSQ
jgi:YhgE/Pip-like protein